MCNISVYQYVSGNIIIIIITAKFCLMMDMFFDCLNVRNTSEFKDKLKPFLKPQDSVDDVRFDWLDQFIFMVHRTLENLEISWDEKDDLDNLEITWDFFHSPTFIFYFHAIPGNSNNCINLFSIASHEERK